MGDRWTVWWGEGGGKGERASHSYGISVAGRCISLVEAVSRLAAAFGSMMDSSSVAFICIHGLHYLLTYAHLHHR